jgi:hypothetical protein
VEKAKLKEKRQNWHCDISKNTYRKGLKSAEEFLIQMARELLSLSTK